MGHQDPGFLAVGFLVKAHGLAGELVVSSLTDYPEGTFAPGVVLFLADGTGRRPDDDHHPMKIMASRPFKGGFLVYFDGVTDRNEAEALRGRYLLRDASEVEPPAEGEFFYHQLLGLQVFTVDGMALGRIREVYELSPVDILDVRGEGREAMIPFRDEIIVEVDLEAGRMVIDPPEGLLDL